MNDFLFGVDWQQLFIPSAPLMEIIIRGTVVYFVIILLLRLIKNRNTGSLSSSDFIFVLLLAASVHYSLTGGNTSITFGIGVIIVIIFWNQVLNHLSYHNTRIKRFLNPSPLPLVKDGKFIRHNMRREFLTEEEVLTELRKQGIRSLARVEEAHIEADGEISFILKEPEQNTRRKARRK